MPARNSEKIYLEDGYYHLYNRGVEKRVIFSDSQDYSVFLSYLRDYLSPKDTIGLMEKLNENLKPAEKRKFLSLIRLNNFHTKIELLAYALMPNHFHLLVKQKDHKAIDEFINSLITRYVMYFNCRHQRVGHLFQDVYKAVLVDSEEQLLHLSRYIHRNPLDLGENSLDHQKMYTSLPEYLGKRETTWINSKAVTEHFSHRQSRLSDAYQSFVEKTDEPDYLINLGIDNI